MNILDPYDSAIAGIERIQSISIIHGEPLVPKDANVNFINVTSNIPLPYEDKIDGCVDLKEKENIFTWWPKKYLEKSSI